MRESNHRIHQMLANIRRIAVPFRLFLIAVEGCYWKGLQDPYRLTVRKRSRYQDLQTDERASRFERDRDAS